MLRGMGATTLPGAKLRRILQISSVGAGVQSWSPSNVFTKSSVMGWVGGVASLGSSRVSAPSLLSSTAAVSMRSASGGEVWVSGKTSHLRMLWCGSLHDVQMLEVSQRCLGFVVSNSRHEMQVAVSCRKRRCTAVVASRKYRQLTISWSSMSSQYQQNNPSSSSSSSESSLAVDEGSSGAVLDSIASRAKSGVIVQRSVASTGFVSASSLIGAVRDSAGMRVNVGVQVYRQLAVLACAPSGGSSLSAWGIYSGAFALSVAIGPSQVFVGTA